MKKLRIKIDPEVKKVFNICPELVRNKLLHLRKLILDTAKDSEDIIEIEETLKWGEPSYLVNKGSTLRIDWKQKNPIHSQCISNARASWS